MKDILSVQQFYTLSIHSAELHRQVNGDDQYIGQVDFWSRDEIEDFGVSLGLKASSRLLDIGSGLGGPACHLSMKTHCSVVGFDTSAEFVQAAIRTAEKKGCAARVRFDVGDIADALLDTDCFDAVMAIDSLVHMRDRLALFDKIRRWLKPGGKFLVATECIAAERESEVLKRREALGVVKCMSRETLSSLFGASGFKVVSWSEHQTKRAVFAKRALEWLVPHAPALAIENMKAILDASEMEGAIEVAALAVAPRAGK